MYSKLGGCLGVTAKLGPLADKGVAMVIMDRQDYINKANHLLNQNTYKTITKDPTNSIKKQTN